MDDVKIRTKIMDNGSLLVRLLIPHPMESGRRKDPVTGRTVPAHFIQEITVLRRDKIVARCQCGPGLAKEPYLALKLLNGNPGDKLRVEWRDNLGGSGSGEAFVEPPQV